MKLKKRIVEDWSLEAKDNYQLLREKVIFAENPPHKKFFSFTKISFALASLVIVFLAISFGYTITNMTKNNTNMDDAFSPSNPGMDSDNKVDGEDLPADKEEAKPNEPGVNNDYDLFIESIKNFKIDADKIYLLEFLNDNNERYELKDLKTISNYFNNLKYEQKEILEDLPSLESQIAFNKDWLIIYFGDQNVVVFAYEGKYIEYTVNTESVYQDLKEGLLK